AARGGPASRPPGRWARCPSGAGRLPRGAHRGRGEAIMGTGGSDRDGDQGRDSRLGGLDLNDVPWASLQHAYGGATDTPRHLLGLASEDLRAREEAYVGLSLSIYHQGSIYPAAVATVPFLIEILRTPTPARKEEVLDLLALLATGRGAFENQQLW